MFILELLGSFTGEQLWLTRSTSTVRNVSSAFSRASSSNNAIYYLCSLFPYWRIILSHIEDWVQYFPLCSKKAFAEYRIQCTRLNKGQIYDINNKIHHHWIWQNIPENLAENQQTLLNSFHPSSTVKNKGEELSLKIKKKIKVCSRQGYFLLLSMK